MSEARRSPISEDGIARLDANAGTKHGSPGAGA